MRVIYFTTLMIPGKGPTVVLLNKDGLIKDGSMEYNFIRQRGLTEDLMFIARYEKGQGAIRIMDNGRIEINQIVRLPKIKLPYPRYIRNQNQNQFRINSKVI